MWWPQPLPIWCTGTGNCKFHKQRGWEWATKAAGMDGWMGGRTRKWAVELIPDSDYMRMEEEQLTQQQKWTSGRALCVGVVEIQAYKYLEELYKKKQSDVMRFLLRLRAWEYRQLNVIHRASRPSRPDKARRLGYKAKQGYVIYRIRVRRGGRKRPVPKGQVYGKPGNQGILQLKYQRSLRATAEERIGRRCPNLRVLNSYWVNEDATYKYFEVIAVDPSHKAIRRDARINWIAKPVHKRREARALTSIGKKNRGIGKGHGFNKTIGGGRSASWKRRNTLSLRRMGCSSVLRVVVESVVVESTLEDKVVGAAIMALSAAVFVYYTLWVFVLPFVPADHFLGSFFLDRIWAIRIPVALLIVGLTGVGGVTAMLTRLVISSYTGSSDEATNLPHGEGTATFLNRGSTYTGAWRSGLMEGRGTFRWDDGTAYQGTLAGNKITGSGVYRWTDGSLYRGGVKSGLRNGNGVFTCAAREATYKGDWVDGKHHGYGVLIYDSSGTCYYEGEWVDGVKSGKGVMHYSSGNVYDGEWANNQKHGRGKMIWKDCGEVYVGEWEKGLQSGSGVYTWPLRHPAKKWRYPFENQYEGQWKFGLREGSGKFVYASGAIYQGEWRGNRKNGPGVFITENGVRYTDTPYEFIINDLVSDVECIQAGKDLNATITRHISVLNDIYETYSSVGPMKYPRDPRAALSRMQLWRLIDDYRIHKKGKTMTDMDRAYAAGYQNDDLFKHRFEDPHAVSEQFIFYDFVQYLIRVANLLYAENEASFPNEHILASRLGLFLKNDILPQLHNLTRDPDNPRELLLNKVESVFAEKLRAIYEKNTKKFPRALNECRQNRALLMRDVLWILNEFGLFDATKGPLTTTWVLSYFQERSPDNCDWNLEVELTFYEMLVILFDCALARARARGPGVTEHQVVINLPLEIPVIAAPSDQNISSPDPTVEGAPGAPTMSFSVPGVEVEATPTLGTKASDIDKATVLDDSKTIVRPASSGALPKTTSASFDAVASRIAVVDSGPEIVFDGSHIAVTTGDYDTSTLPTFSGGDCQQRIEIIANARGSIDIDPQQVVNLDPQQLNVAVWSGDVVLKNLRLKREALDKFQLPIDVVSGYIGELTMQIPWSDLRGSPVKILVRNVYVLAGPKAEADYDPKLEEERGQAAKQEKLKALEALSNQSTSTSLETPETQTFLTQLTTKIIDNLQFTFTDIHIRYEDKSTNPKHPFGFGVSLKELTAVSTDADGRPAFVQETDTIHKLLTLKCLAVYFNTSIGVEGAKSAGHKQLLNLTPDEFRATFAALIASPDDTPKHQYVLRPVSGTGRMHIKKHQYKQDGKNNEIDLDFDDFALGLDRDQYSNALMLASAFARYSKAYTYRKYRPPHSSTPATHPKEWLLFAGTSVLSDIRDRNRKWSWSFFQERRNDRLAYVKLWNDRQKRLKMVGAAPGKPAAQPNADADQGLEELERKLSYEDIRLYRSYAMMELQKEETEAVASPSPQVVESTAPESSTAESESQDSGAQATAESSFGWLSSWWSGGTSTAVPTKTAAATNNASTTTSLVPSLVAADDIERIFESIEYDPSKVFEAAAVPRDFVKWIINMQLKTGSLHLLTDQQQEIPKTLASLTFDGFKTEYLLRPDSWRLTWDLKGMSLFDGSSSSTLFPLLIQAKRSKASSDATETDSSVTFLHGVFEQNPLDIDADLSVKLKLLPLEIVYTPTIVTALTDFFRPSAAHSEGTEFLLTYAEDTVHSITSTTRAGLELLVLQQKTALVVLDLDAPVFVIPESVSTLETTVVALDMGHLLVESKPVSSSSKDLVKKRQGKKLSPDEFLQLQQMAYDKWAIKLSDVQVLVGRSVEGTLRQLSDSTANTEFDYHFVERIEALVDVDVCRIQEVELPLVKVAARIPNIQVNFSDFKYQRLMYSLDSVLAPLIGTSISKQNSSSSLDSQTESANGQNLNVVDSEPVPVAGGQSPNQQQNDASPLVSDVGTRNSTETPESVDESRYVYFQLEMNLDRASFAVKKADQVHSSEKTLADLTITGMQLQVETKKFELGVALHIHDAYITDKVHGDQGDKYLMEPLYRTLGFTGEPISDDAHLVDVRYASVSSTHPDFTSKYDSVNQKIDVALQTVLLNVNPESILSLYDFTLVTFAPPTLPSNATGPSHQEPSDTPAVAKAGTGSEENGSNSLTSAETKIYFSLDMKGVRLVINDKNLKRLATADIKRGQVAIVSERSTTVVRGTLGDILLVDDVGYRSPFKEIISIEGDRVADFEFHTYDRTTLGYPGYDSSLRITGESVKLTYIEPAFTGLLDWMKEFEQMRKVYEAARRAAIDSAVQMQQSAGRFHFNIQFKSPIVVLPRPNADCYDFLEAHLGEISAVNLFEHIKSDEEVLATRNAIKVELQSMTLHSAVIGSDGVVALPPFPILEDVSPPPIPGTEVQATFSPINVDVDERQYAMLLETFVFLTSSGSSTSQSGPSSEQKNEEKMPKITAPAEVNLAILLKFESIELKLLRGDRIVSGSDIDTAMAAAKITGTHQVRLGTASVTDIRKDAHSHYREILLPGNGDDQIVVDYSATETGDAMIVVTVDSPQAVLPPELVLAIADWVMHPKHFKAPRNTPTNTNDLIPSLELEPKSRFSFRIKFIDADIAILDDPAIKETEAVYLKAKQIVVTYEDAVKFSIKEGGLWICAMNRRSDTSLRLFHNFDLSATYDQRDTAPGHQLTAVSLDVPKQLNVRLSFNDILLFGRVVNKITKSFGSNSIDNALLDTPKKAESILAPAPSPQRDETILRHESVHVGKFELLASNWSDNLDMTLFLNTSVNCYNLKVSQWEPLLEPIVFNATISRTGRDDELNIDLSPRGKVEINLTHQFVQSCLDAFNSVGTVKEVDQRSDVSQRNLATRKAGLAPYLLRNRTGYQLIVTSENGTQQTLENDSDTMYKTQDWKTLREGINIESEGSKTFILRPPINGAFHRLVVDVRLRDKIKYVTFRSSLVLRNDCLTPIDVRLKPSGLQGQVFGEYRIGPGDEWAIPIEAAFHDKLQIKPPGSSSGARDQYPEMTIHIYAPLEIENLLPFDVRYAVLDRTRNNDFTDVLRAGQVAPIHSVLPSDVIAFTLSITDIDYHASDVAILSNLELDYRDDKIELRNANRHATLLRFKYIESKKKSTRVQVYSPYWILNRTNLDVTVSAKTILSNSYIASQGAAKWDALSAEVQPFLFSFPSLELRNRAFVKIANSAPSRPLTLDAVGSSYEEVLNATDGFMYHLGVSIAEGEGKYHLTKVVTIAPRFILKVNADSRDLLYNIPLPLSPFCKNDLDEDIHLKQHGTPKESEFYLARKSVQSLMLLEKGADILLKVRTSGLLNEWSAPFRLSDVGSTFLKLGKMGSSLEELVRVTIKVESATIFVHFSREDRWPYRIENRTDIDFYVFQKDNSRRKYPVPRNSQLQYAWDDLMLKKRLIVAAQNVERQISLQEIGPSTPMRIKGASGERLVDVEVKSDGPQIVCLLSDFDPAKSRFREAKRSSFESIRRSTESDRLGATSMELPSKTKERRPGTPRIDDLERIRRPSSTGPNDAREGFEVVGVQDKGLVAFHFGFERLGLSVVGPDAQVDNQMPNALEPIILYPTVIPRVGDTFPVLQGAVLVLKEQENQSFGLEYVKSSDFLVQELSLELDEDILLALVEMMKFESPGEVVERPYNAAVLLPQFPKEEDSKIYFEAFRLQPIRMNLTFTRTERVQKEDATPRSKTVASFFLDVLTMTIGNVHDAKLDFGMLYVENMIVDFGELRDKIIQKYYSDVMSQLHRVIGSADVLGNPLGLFNNISSGVQDFFYEPYAGMVEVNPESVVLGLRSGTAKLINKTAFSVSDTFQKITGSLGKGLAVASMDDEYQRQRRNATLRKNRPKDPFSGITSGVVSFGQSLTSAVTGVVTQPMKGASRGVEGVAKGLMRGTIGLVTKPVAGIFDLASNVTDGIRASTQSPGIGENQLDRIRLPRYIGKDNVLRPFDEYKARGQWCLRLMQDENETPEYYVYHCELADSPVSDPWNGGEFNIFALVTDRRVLRVRFSPTSSTATKEWAVEFEDVFLAPRIDPPYTVVLSERHGATKARERALAARDEGSATIKNWLMEKQGRMDVAVLVKGLFIIFTRKNIVTTLIFFRFILVGLLANLVGPLTGVRSTQLLCKKFLFFCNNLSNFFCDTPKKRYAQYCMQVQHGEEVLQLQSRTPLQGGVVYVGHDASGGSNVLKERFHDGLVQTRSQVDGNRSSVGPFFHSTSHHPMSLSSISTTPENTFAVVGGWERIMEGRSSSGKTNHIQLTNLDGQPCGDSDAASFQSKETDIGGVERHEVKETTPHHYSIQGQSNVPRREPSRLSSEPSQSEPRSRTPNSRRLQHLPRSYSSNAVSSSRRSDLSRNSENVAMTEHSETLTSLKEMFPRLEHESLQSVLQKQNNDVERAVEVLLAFDELNLTDAVEVGNVALKDNRTGRGFSEDIVGMSEDEIDLDDLMRAVGVPQQSSPHSRFPKMKTRHLNEKQSRQRIMELGMFPHPLVGLHTSPPPRPRSAATSMDIAPISDTPTPRHIRAGSEGAVQNGVRGSGEDYFSDPSAVASPQIPNSELESSSDPSGLYEMESYFDRLSGIFSTVPRSILQRLVFLAEVEGTEDPIQEVIERLLPLMIEPPAGVTFEELVEQQCDGNCEELGERCWWHSAAPGERTQDLLDSGYATNSLAPSSNFGKRRNSTRKGKTFSFVARGVPFPTPSPASRIPPLNASWSTVAAAGTENLPTKGSVGIVQPAVQNGRTTPKRVVETPKLIYLNSRDDPASQAASSSHLTGRDRRFDGWDGDSCSREDGKREYQNIFFLGSSLTAMVSYQARRYMQKVHEHWARYDEIMSSSERWVSVRSEYTEYSYYLPRRNRALRPNEVDLHHFRAAAALPHLEKVLNSYSGSSQGILTDKARWGPTFTVDVFLLFATICASKPFFLVAWYLDNHWAG
ncbi:hypothetical protein M427DRAFT_47658 [Gonapodya prolifera JEL478]|uniref:Ribosomal protein L15 n=1 Tax=Gonapodya prolifera (strain JEL478) TaxID=1344416 RepID=A0A139A278_GONPJ|nr:hypothetical protein M427DRAFT_47658 [Gonapodya prolifera JEL478]|eukprot:KXS10872.1 hypothetical protein M427DRAFT_47658 [Gonapodya prolifera JEL478]